MLETKMATSITNMKSVLQTTVRVFGRSKYPSSICSVLPHQRNKASWSNFFKKETDPEPAEEWSSPVRKIGPKDGPSTVSRLDSLKKKEGLISVRGYDPPQNVDEKVSAVAQSVLGTSIDFHTPVTDRKSRFQLCDRVATAFAEIVGSSSIRDIPKKLVGLVSVPMYGWILTRLMDEFDHFIPNTELTDLHTLDDIVAFFSTPVKDRSSYEDMAKLDLPKNLHIQMDPVRFDAERDTFFDGKNAFIDRPTVVSSLKQRRKYAGNIGESRHQRNMTALEEQIMYARKT